MSLIEIIFDTETTGTDPLDGDRVIEIGCIELENHLPTGRTYHVYINPERDVPAEAVAVHGLTEERLKDEPIFAEIIGDFMEFIGEDSKLVAHNADFDIGFLNAEFKKLGFPSIDKRRVVDTLALARKKFPGSPANLDALCRRFGIDNSNRELHGALLDSELLAEVYLELLGGRQRGLGLASENSSSGGQQNFTAPQDVNRPYREPRTFVPSKEELAAHAKMQDDLKDSLWKSA
jgi:DNA polymerase-3 subunit epsilon